MENNKKFEVSKQLLESFIEEGMTMKEMAEKLTQLGGRTCSVGTVRILAKHYDLDLRKKSRQFFVPVSEDNVEENLQSTPSTEELFPETTF